MKLLMNVLSVSMEEVGIFSGRSEKEVMLIHLSATGNNVNSTIEFWGWSQIVSNMMRI